MIEIRKVRNGDERSLAFIQTQSWKAAFKNILSQETLNKCTDYNTAITMYTKLLDKKSGNGYILEVEHKPHCIAWWDKTREKNMTGYAELICIHSLQDNWHRGYGSKMMDTILDDVTKAGYSRIMLWVFVDNVRAIKFYKKYGFIPSGQKKNSFGALEEMYTKEIK